MAEGICGVAGAPGERADGEAEAARGEAGRAVVGAHEAVGPGLHGGAGFVEEFAEEAGEIGREARGRRSKGAERAQVRARLRTTAAHGSVRFAPCLPQAVCCSPPRAPFGLPGRRLIAPLQSRGSALDCAPLSLGMTGLFFSLRPPTRPTTCAFRLHCPPQLPGCFDRRPTRPPLHRGSQGLRGDGDSAKFGDDFGEDFEGFLNLGFGVEAAEGEAEAGAGALVGEAHGFEDVGGVDGAGGTGGAAGTTDVVLVEEHERAFGVDAFKGEVGGVGQPVFGVASDVGAFDLGKDAGFEIVAEFADGFLFVLEVLAGDFAGFA